MNVQECSFILPEGYKLDHPSLSILTYIVAHVGHANAVNPSDHFTISTKKDDLI